MSRIHPAAGNKCQDHPQLQNAHDHCVPPSALTVWKRSSMSFQGTDGFTVFDDRGILTFRVDNYSRKNCCVRGGIVLMDGAGRALLSLKPQVLSMQDQWNAYRGEDGCGKSQKSSRVFAMRSGSGVAATNLKQLRCSWELMQLAPQISKLRVVLGDEIAKSEAAVDSWWPV